MYVENAYATMFILILNIYFIIGTCRHAFAVAYILIFFLYPFIVSVCMGGCAYAVVLSTF